MADTTLKITTYNIENLFDLKESGDEYKEYRPSLSNWNQKTYKTKLKHISQVLKDIDADIVALQEIESLQALKDLRFTLKQNELYYPYYEIASKKGTTVKVALLSKLPFIYAKSLQVTPSKKFRDILEVKFKTTQMSEPFYLFINHWKAKSGAESKRIASAKVLRKRVKELGYDKNIILLGDFNSHYEEYKTFLRKRRHNDTGGKTGINDVLRTKQQQTPYSCVMKQEQRSFYNLWYDEEESKRFSYIFRGKKEALDNILISQSLVECKGMHYLKDSIDSFDASYLYDGKKIYRWKVRGKKHPKHKGKGYSDHLAVSAEFLIK